MKHGDNEMLTIGHRGLKAEYPENTVTAVHNAARFVDLVEIDVRPCASGELVVAHDDDLEGITGREGRISETTLDVLQNVTVIGSDESIPSFDEVLMSWPDATGINVDIKGSTSVGTVLSRLATADIHGPAVISVTSATVETFDPSATNRAVGLSFWRDHVENVRKATHVDCDYVHVHKTLCLETDVVERAHDAGLSVDAWSIDNAETASQLATIGVDAITVNRRDAIP